MGDGEKNGVPMHVSRKVIMDLLPLYAGGEASAETRALVEEYLSLDDALRQEVERDGLLKEIELPTTNSRLSDEAELRAFRRTQTLLRWQRRIYACAVTFSVLSAGGVGRFQDGKFTFHFFLHDYPQLLWPCISIAVSCWVYYLLFWGIRSRLSSIRSRHH